MKKLFVIAAFTLVMVTGASAVDIKTPGDVAIGPVFSHNVIDVAGPLGGWGITGKIGGLPPVWGFNFAVGSNVTFVGLTADWWLFQQTLYAPWNVNLYIGPGFFGDFSQTTQTAFDLGLRIPFDLDIFPLQPLEFFVELAPAFGISFTDPIAPTWRLQAAGGARFWF